MTSEFQVQKAGLAGQNWVTVCRGSEAKAREVYQRQLRLYTIGRFRLVDANGVVAEEGSAAPRFRTNCRPPGGRTPTPPCHPSGRCGGVARFVAASWNRAQPAGR